MDAAPATLSETAYRQIREMVFSGDIRPGEKLRLEPLAARVGMGTTPLREALSRLSSEGFVVAQGQRGYWAASVSREEYEQITELRVDLECKAFAQSMKAGGIDWESAVVAAFHQLSRASKRLGSAHPVPFAEWERLNRQFHLTLIQACGNAWLLRFTHMLFDQSERYRSLALAARAVPLKANDAEHRRLMEFAIARDEAGGVALLKDHIARSARAALATIFGEAKKKGHK